jgi:hypothetical protein
MQQMLRRKKLLKLKKLNPKPQPISKEDRKHLKLVAECLEKAKKLKNSSSTWRKQYASNFPKNPYEKLSNGFAPGGEKKSLFDTTWKRTYEDDPVMAEREQEALKQAELKKQHLMPAYNKGPIMFDPNKNLKDNDRRPKSY